MAVYRFWTLVADFEFWRLVADSGFWTLVANFVFQTLVADFGFCTKMTDFGFRTVVVDSGFWTLMADFEFWTLVADLKFLTLVVDVGFWAVMAYFGFWPLEADYLQIIVKRRRKLLKHSEYFFLLCSVLSRQKSSKCHQIKTVKARSLICIANFFNALILYSTLSNVTTRGVETLASPGKRSLNIGLCRKNCRHKSIRRKGLSLELQCPPHHQKCLVYVWVWRKQWRRL